MTDRFQLRWVPDLQLFYASLSGVTFRSTEPEYAKYEEVMEGGGATPDEAVHELHQHLVEYFKVFPDLVAYKDNDETTAYRYINREWMAVQLVG